MSGEPTYQAQGCADAVKISRVEEILVANSGEPSFLKGTINMVVALLVLTLAVQSRQLPRQLRLSRSLNADDQEK
jgi:hypothetical protein